MALAQLAGTGFEGRAGVIKRHCKPGMEVQLVRDPENKHDPNAIKVLLKVPRLFGLLGSSWQQIGFIKAKRAEKWAKKLDQGKRFKAEVSSMYAPPGRDYPRVTIEATEANQPEENSANLQN